MQPEHQRRGRDESQSHEDQCPDTELPESFGRGVNKHEPGKFGEQDEWSDLQERHQCLDDSGDPERGLERCEQTAGSAGAPLLLFLGILGGLFPLGLGFFGEGFLALGFFL